MGHVMYKENKEISIVNRFVFVKCNFQSSCNCQIMQKVYLCVFSI